MKITFDAEASYIYFTSIEPGGAFETFIDLRLDVEFDKDEKIAAMRLWEAEDCRFQNRLKYALHCPQTTFDEKTKSILIAFTTKSEPTKIISWEANVDVDEEGQILGLEILFAEPDYEPADGRKRLYSKGKLDHLSKYIVPITFDELIANAEEAFLELNRMELNND